jgi:hypothetical protein
MEFIRTIREKSQTRREEEIQRMAEETITLSDFESQLYIAYLGTPFVPINEDWSSKQIIEELAKLRQNFINARMKERGLTKLTAVL